MTIKLQVQSQLDVIEKKTKDLSEKLPLNMCICISIFTNKRQSQLT